uniref:DNA-directed RNA polymerases I, II, and III subunit RPABC1 n=1 Tax=Aegilops tauschii TaxID=37682 RepID=M8BXY1_AEGTA
MLRDRGYSVPEDELARTLPEFRAWWSETPEIERLSFSTTLASDESNKSKITSRARESIKEMFKFKVDVFQITELLVNITKHVLKPKHEVLTAEEKAKLLKQYNVVDSQLPRMLETDAVARYYGLGKGTVVKFTYDSELTVDHVTYRCIRASGLILGGESSSGGWRFGYRVKFLTSFPIRGDGVKNVEGKACKKGCRVQIHESVTVASKIFASGEIWVTVTDPCTTKETSSSSEDHRLD